MKKTRKTRKAKKIDDVLGSAEKGTLFGERLSTKNYDQQLFNLDKSYRKAWKENDRARINFYSHAFNSYKKRFY